MGGRLAVPPRRGRRRAGRRHRGHEAGRGAGRPGRAPVRSAHGPDARRGDGRGCWPAGGAGHRSGARAASGGRRRRLRRADDAGRRPVSPLNIPAWRGFPLRARLAGAHRAAGVRRQRRQGPGAGRGVGGRGRRRRDYIAMVVSTGVGGGIVLDGRLLDGAAGNAGHIGHVIVEPDGRPCAVWGARGCLEAEASGLAIAGMTGPTPRGRRGRAAARARSSAGRWRRSPTCSTCGWRWWPARWRSASATVLRRRPGRAGRPLPASTSPWRRPHPARQAWATPVRSSAPPPWGGGAPRRRPSASPPADHQPRRGAILDRGLVQGRDRAVGVASVGRRRGPPAPLAVG